MKYSSLVCTVIIRLPESASPGGIVSHTLTDGGFGNLEVIPTTATFSLAKDLQPVIEAVSCRWSESVANQSLLHVTGSVQAPSGSEVTRCPQQSGTEPFKMGKKIGKQGPHELRAFGSALLTGLSVHLCSLWPLFSNPRVGGHSSPSLCTLQGHGAHFIPSHMLLDCSAPTPGLEYVPILS